jgi:16S rRNA (cytosine1402-N4)-methyltransferase
MLHHPILTERFLSFFENRTIRTFIDGTLGAGGHAYALLQKHPEIQSFWGIDQDHLALEIAAQKLSHFGNKVKLIQGNFRDLKKLITEENADGIFLDLGVSSMQLDRPEKGFSLYKEGPLDMRMHAGSNLDAAKVVNTFSEKELGKIFRDFGEEPRWRLVAKTLVAARKKRRMETTKDLTEALKHVLTWGGRKGKKIHPMTLVFQALRIYVNDELGALQEAIPQAISLLVPGGRMGIISFHSLEDRIVKHTFRHAAHQKQALILTKKPIIAEHEEIRQNPRSRSAKLRFLEKL